MLNTKHRAKNSRMKEMREDLSIILGVQRGRQLAAAVASTPHRSRSQYWRHIEGLGGRTEPRPPNSVGLGRNSTPSTETTIDCVPKFVTAAQCRVASATRCPRRAPSTGWGIYSSRPIVRPSPQASNRPTRVPMSSFFRNVQRPPETPQNPQLVINSNTNASVNEVLLQSPWVSRESTEVKQPVTTSRYSVQELIDILCGDRPQDSEILATTRAESTMAVSSKVINKRKPDDLEKNNEAYALGKIKVPRKPKTPKLNLLPFYDDLSSVTLFPNTKQAQSETENLDLFSLDNSFGSTGSSDGDVSFLSGSSPVLFEDEPFKIPVPRKQTPAARKCVTFNETVNITPVLSEPFDLCKKTPSSTSKLLPLQPLSFNLLSSTHPVDLPQRPSSSCSNYMDFEQENISLSQQDLALCRQLTAPGPTSYPNPILHENVSLSQSLDLCRRAPGVGPVSYLNPNPVTQENVSLSQSLDFCLKAPGPGTASYPNLIPVPQENVPLSQSLDFCLKGPGPGRASYLKHIPVPLESMPLSQSLDLCLKPPGPGQTSGRDPIPPFTPVWNQKQKQPVPQNIDGNVMNPGQASRLDFGFGNDVNQHATLLGLDLDFLDEPLIPFCFRDT